MIGQSPFFLTYGSEAILPADIMWKSPRVEAYQEGKSDEAQQLELDSVEEARINALTQSTRYLQGLRRYHDQHPAKIFQYMRSSPTKDSRRNRIAQVKFQMGGTFHRN